MVIGFKKQFVEPILHGTKVLTIRDDKNGRWKPGMIMHMYTGGRFSKEYHQFDEKICLSTQRVFMTYTHILEITVGNTELFGYNEREKFAKEDGFENLKAFEAWWIPEIKKNAGQELSRKVIHWTALRY
jgi:hypothetical protein